jgi:hypothetical protein
MSGHFEHTNKASNALRQISDQSHDVEESVPSKPDSIEPETEVYFDPAVRQRQKNGSYQMKLPQSMYTSIILMPMVEPPSIPIATLIIVHAPQYLVYLLVICAQFTICGFLYRALDDTKAKVCLNASNSDTFLMFVCVATFCSFCFSDLLETVGIFRWVDKLPLWDEGQRALVEKMKTGSLIFKEVSKRESIGRCPNQRVTVSKPVTGISKRFKSNIALFVLLPKLAIAIALLFIGSGFILRAEGVSRIVLNTVSVTFVLQVDEYAYRGFTTSSMKILFESIPPIGLLEQEITADIYLNYWEAYGTIFMLLFLMLTVIVQFWSWCWE